MCLKIPFLFGIGNKDYSLGINFHSELSACPEIKLDSTCCEAAFSHHKTEMENLKRVGISLADDLLKAKRMIVYYYLLLIAIKKLKLLQDKAILHLLASALSI